MKDESFEQSPSEQPTSSEASESAPAPTSALPRRALKLVLSLQPEDGPSARGYRALLAIGAEGCDPLFRSVEVDGLTAALGEVPALVAEAAARWQTEPRYPATGRRQPKAADRQSGSGEAANPPAPGGATGRDAAAEPGAAAGAQPVRLDAKPAPKPAPADQLSLFG